MIKLNYYLFWSSERFAVFNPNSRLNWTFYFLLKNDAACFTVHSRRREGGGISRRSIFSKQRTLTSTSSFPCLCAGLSMNLLSYNTSESGLQLLQSTERNICVFFFFKCVLPRFDADDYRKSNSVQKVVIENNQIYQWCMLERASLVCKQKPLFFAVLLK